MTEPASPPSAPTEPGRRPETPPGPTQPVNPEGPPGAGPTTDPPKSTPGPAEPGGGSGYGPADSRGDAAGSGTERQDAKREAHRLYGVNVEGDQVGRDKIVVIPGRGQPIRLNAVSPLVIDAVQLAFVPPPGWDELRKRAAHRRTTVLHGPAGIGRETMAMRLLLDCGAKELYALPPDAPGALDRLADGLQRHPEVRASIKDAGLVLRDPPGGPGLHTRLRDLDAALERANAHLVLRLGSGMRATDEDLYDYLEPVEAGASHADIVVSHLRMLLGSMQTDRLCANPELKELIDTFASPTTSRKRAADLAQFIKRYTDGDSTDLARVRAELDRREEGDFDIWFGGLSPDDQCFALALAVLSELSYENVAAAAKQLRTDLSSATLSWTSISGGAGEAGQRERTDRLRDLRAHEVDVYDRGSFGRLVGKGLEYRDESYPKLVIERVWQRGHDQEPVLQWLRALAEAGPVRIRVRAATVMGVLATHSFQYLCDRVFSPWADDAKWERRDAVAYALSVPAADARFSGNVRQLVADWHGQSERPLVQATAARSYGATLVGEDLDWALDRLGRLSAVGATIVTYAVGESVEDLMYRHDDEPAELVLSTLRRWLSNPGRESAAIRAFLSIAHGLVTQEERRPSGTLIERPALLVLADGAPRLRAELTTMWAAALESWQWPGHAELVLTSWARMAEADALLRMVFAEMLSAVARAGPRPRRLLRRIVDDWASEDHLVPLPCTVVAIRSRMRWSGPVAAGTGGP